MSISVAYDTQRLEALYAFHILDSAPEPAFEQLVSAARHVCHTPIATVTLVDRDRQWFKAVSGLDITETPRAVALCSYTVEHTGFWQVPDLKADPRFRDNPLVTGAPFLRFYAAIPLRTSNGFNIGAFAVMDRRPRQLSRDKIAVLEVLAAQAMTLIVQRRQEYELRATLASMHDAQKIANLGSWTMETASRALYLSDQTYQIFGVELHDEPVAFDQFLSSVHIEDRPKLIALLERSLSTGEPFDLVHRIVRRRGEIRHVHARGKTATHPAYGVVLSGTVQDITEQRRSQEELELLHTCISRVQDIVMITEAAPLEEPGPRIVFVNKAFHVRTGYSPEEVLGRSPRLLQGPETQRTELDRLRTALQRQERISVELINYQKDGQKYWTEIDIDPVVAIDGAATHFVAVQRDITLRKETEKQIERLAFFDPLTGLPNRRLLQDRLAHALAIGARKRTCGALLFLDLDNFKALNDTLGHDKGDELLKQVASRLESVVRKSNTVARLGGDEFVLLLEDLSDDPTEAATHAEIVAEKALRCFASVFRIGDVEHRCTPSIGVAMFNHTPYSAEEILKRADVAMYQAKAAGRNTIRFFDQQMQLLVDTRVAVDRDLRSSLGNGGFVLHYQPQANLDGSTVGVEALIRWNHPSRGMLLPAEFIALAEESGFIVQLGQWVLQAACAQIVQWQKNQTHCTPRVSVNISAKQLRAPDFVAQTIAILEQTGVDPCALLLELTESSLLDQPEDAIEKMIALKNYGLHFSLDDFGTGYSSLAYLKRLPLEEIKIDRAFVHDILGRPEDAAIAKTIVSLGAILGLKVIAEGVETREQRDALAGIGCMTYQGYFISPPVAASGLFH